MIEKIYADIAPQLYASMKEQIKTIKESKEKINVDITYDIQRAKARQQNKCSICEQSFNSIKTYTIKTNDGLSVICENCNNGLSFFNYNLYKLKNAIEILRKKTD